MKIIVVDDEMHALHDFLNAIIGEETVEYRFFRDDPDAILHYVSETHLDGAFLDINMATINGFELSKKLLELQPDIKIAFITGLLFEEKNIPSSISPHAVSLIHKPYRREDLEEALRRFSDSPKPILIARLFDRFDCFINGRPILFSSSKSKELFALILAKNGKTVTMEEAISCLYPDRETDKAKILYRDAVWRLRKTLEEAHCECMNFQRAMLLLDKSQVKADYFDLLAGKNVYFDGTFLPEYKWAVPIRKELITRFPK